MLQDIPAKVIAKIVQVLLHLNHTQETENGKQWMYKATIYSDLTKLNDEEW